MFTPLWTKQQSSNGGSTQIGLDGLLPVNRMTYGDSNAQQPQVPQSQPQTLQQPSDMGQPPSTNDMYSNASNTAYKNYGYHVSPVLLRAMQMQESSNKVDPSNYNLSMGFTPSAQKALGSQALPSTSLDNVMTNSANYMASRALHQYPDGTTKDLSQPNNWSTWYTQKYVGLLPGQSRKIGNQMVTYDQVKKSFEKVLSSMEQPRTLVDNK